MQSVDADIPVQHDCSAGGETRCQYWDRECVGESGVGVWIVHLACEHGTRVRAGIHGQYVTDGGDVRDGGSKYLAAEEISISGRPR